MSSLDVFCGWGDGPDVGINIHTTGDRILRSKESNDVIVPVDLTAARAREVAADLIRYATEAERLDAMCAEHDAIAKATEADA